MRVYRWLLLLERRLASVKVAGMAASGPFREGAESASSEGWEASPSVF